MGTEEAVAVGMRGAGGQARRWGGEGAAAMRRWGATVVGRWGRRGSERARAMQGRGGAVGRQGGGSAAGWMWWRHDDVAARELREIYPRLLVGLTYISFIDVWPCDDLSLVLQNLLCKFNRGDTETSLCQWSCRIKVVCAIRRRKLHKY
jgi:hypothetical protein